jgi:hypothetical protein
MRESKTSLHLTEADNTQYDAKWGHSRTRSLARPFSPLRMTTAERISLGRTIVGDAELDHRQCGPKDQGSDSEVGRAA